MNKKVVVLGGGVAGMSSAHELIMRGFQVEVYELQKEIPGGKARSMPVPNSASDGRDPLPAEHGFRFFPRFYKHVTDTMSQIPFKNNKNGVLDNLVQADRAFMARYGETPITMVTRFPRSFKDLKAIMGEMYGSDTGLTKDDLEFFAERMWQLMTSCEERRLAEYEQISWWDFIKADGRSEAYQNYLAIGLTRTLVAAKAKEASARTGGDILLQLMFDMLTPGTSSDRLLNGPTNDAWIDPWLTFLKSKGVDYNFNARTKAIECNENQITGATVVIDGIEKKIQADYYIAALPVEVFTTLVTPNMAAIDKSFNNIAELSTNVSWMNGIQFYLKNDVPVVHGHAIYIDTEWALTSISQNQFWKDYDFNNFGDGEAKGVLSVDISDWFTPGETIKDKDGNTLAAHQCTREQIKDEVWHQLKKSLNVEGKTILKDDNMHSWFLDPDIVIPNKERVHDNVNMEPLLINKKNTWNLRPKAITAIPNLFLASDYVQTYTDLATMEGANEAARRAVNGILDLEDSPEQRCELWKLHEPELIKPWKNHDKRRFDKGEVWSIQKTGWLKIFMIFWTAYCLLKGVANWLSKKTFPNHIDLNANKRRKWFILVSMFVSVGCLAIAAWKFKGWESAAIWSLGFSALYFLYAFIFRDKLMFRFLIFATFAGFTELIADYWLVNITDTLIYPANEPMLFVSPAYMPFSWIVVLIQIGFIGFLISKQKSLIVTSLVVGVLGCIIIPIYEYFAINAEWWFYEACEMWGIVPIYIFIAEGLLMLSIPNLFNRCENASLKWIPLLGITQGLVMWLACIAAFYLFG